MTSTNISLPADVNTGFSPGAPAQTFFAADVTAVAASLASGTSCTMASAFLQLDGDARRKSGELLKVSCVTLTR